MRNLASTIAVGAAFAALSCSGSSSTMTGTGGGPGTAGDGGGTAGTSDGAAGPAEAPPAPREPGAARRAPVGTGARRAARGTTGSGGTGGSTTTLADPCRGTALPTTGHYVPVGHVRAHRSPRGQGELRQLTFSSNGDLWGVNDNGQIKRFRDANGDGVFQTARDRQLGVHRRQRPERAHRRGGRLPLLGNERRACAAGRGRTRPTPAPAARRC